MAMSVKSLRGALLASAMLVQAQSNHTPEAAPPPSAPATAQGGTPAAASEQAHRGRSLRQMREWSARQNTDQAADTLTVEAVTANMS